jgi:TolA-binding protein
VHIVTKILVVFAAVLSVFLAALTIAYSSNADRIVGDFNDQSSRRAAAEASLAAASASQAQALGELQAQVEQLKRDLAQRDDEARRLQGDNARLARERSLAEDERQTVTGKIGEFGETIKTQLSLLAAYSAEVTELRRNELAYRSRELDMADTISDLQAKTDVLTQSNRALAEQLTEARQAMQGGVSAGTLASGAAGAPFTFTGPTIAGRVIDVKPDPATNDTLVTLNVGSNDLVREGMKFAVHRNGVFLANLVIVKVDQRMAIGKVSLLASPTTTLSANDLVQSRFQN